MTRSNLYEDIPGLVYDFGNGNALRFGIREVSEGKFLVFNLLDGREDYASPFSTWQEAYADAVKMIWYHHASDLLIPRIKVMIKKLANEYGLSYKFANELMQWPAGEEVEEVEPDINLDWLRG